MNQAEMILKLEDDFREASVFAIFEGADAAYVAVGDALSCDWFRVPESGEVTVVKAPMVERHSAGFSGADCVTAIDVYERFWCVGQTKKGVTGEAEWHPVRLAFPYSDVDSARR